MSKVNRREARVHRHKRVRKKVWGTDEKPRLRVFKSLKHIYAQLIDDDRGITLASASTLSPDIRNQIEYGGNVKSAKVVGESVAKKAIEKGIKTVVFDRGGYIFHGRVKALAEAAREAGLQF